MKAKDVELREQLTFGTTDIRKIGELEAEMKEIRDRINVVGQKYDIPACCRI